MMTPRLRTRWMSFLVFLLPGMALYVLLFLVPAVQSFLFGFYRWEGYEALGFVGLDNYLQMIDDPILLASLGNVAYFMVINTVLPIGVGLLCAEILSRKAKGTPFFRSVFFLPQVFTLTAVGVIFKWLAHPDYGLVNAFLGFVGLDGWKHAWLGDADTAIHAVGLMSVWLNYGYAMVILLAGIQKISPTLYEAARIDGASRWGEFVSVTLPALRNELTVVLILMLIGSLNAYPLIASATGGGPGYSTYVPALYGFRVFGVQGNIGYGTAIINTLTVVTVLITALAGMLREKEAKS